MKYYINDEVVSYEIFEHYLFKSIKKQTNFALSEKDARFMYCNYYNEIKYYNAKISFKDKMSYKIR